jgi:anaerobic magnesium-protoporphyrin IX monomethyl ester cyclase
MTPTTSNQKQKMLFILPPSRDEGLKEPPSHHPIITATLSGIARESGAEAIVIDALISGHSRKEIVQIALRLNVDWIGIIPFEYRREMPIKHSIEQAKLLVEGGVSAHIGLLNCPIQINDTDKTIQNNVQFVVYGDSEEAVERFASHADFKANGVSYYGEKGPTQPLTTSSKRSNSVPAWDLFEYQNYIPSAHRYLQQPVLPVIASRSCPFGCDFCPHSLFHTSDTYSPREPEDVVSEIQTLQRLYKVKNIEFYDPTFAINRQKTLELCHLLQNLDKPIGWSCYSRCDLLDVELLTEMKKAGCHTILFGVESGSEEVLSRTGKELELSSVLQMVNDCRKLKIQTIASFILGLPLDDVHSLRETIKFACKLNPTFAQFHQARAFFAHQEWQELGSVTEEWEESTSSVNGLAYIPNALTMKQLHMYLLKAYLRFYARPQQVYTLLRQIHSPADMKRYLQGGQQIVQHIRQLPSFSR